MSYTLKDIINIPKLQELFESLAEIRRLSSAVFDVDGNILITSAWQDICTKFHRINPDTQKKCEQYNTHIEVKLFENTTFISCSCPMGLIEAVYPIIIEGRHLGSVHVGQIFHAPSDEEIFSKQAHQYGFDEKEYLDAMNKVPIYSEEQFHTQILFVGQLVQMMAEQGLQTLKQREISKSLHKSEEFSKRQLKASKELVEMATRVKSEFLSCMSHEIRTPLNGIIGLTTLLLETNLDAEQREYTNHLRLGGESLLSLINDILDFSKIEASKLDFEIIAFDLRVMLEDTADALAIRANEKGLEFICRVDPTVPLMVKGDPGRVRQVITNLVDNAIKFTHEGEVVISADIKSAEDKTAVINFAISDTGIGIPEEKLEVIFNPFSQVDASTTRRFGGTGLGLSISKQLVELMNGQFRVDSTLGCGSAFSFSLPFEIHSTDSKSVYENLPEISGTRILVADGNATSRMLLYNTLKNWGCQPEMANDGATALLMLREAQEKSVPFCVALINRQIPIIDGLELGSQIISNPLLKKTIMVMLTTYGQRGDASVIRNAGFKGYLVKPVRQSQLYDCIAMALSQAMANAEETKSACLVTQHTIVESTSCNSRILVVEDNLINQKVALSMLNKLGYRVDVVNNGLEAVRALELIDYNLVFMDCQMPEMDGFEATKVIRSEYSTVKNHDVPIIALTANVTKHDQEACTDVGMNDFISKPATKEKLASILGKWLENSNSVNFSVPYSNQSELSSF